MVNGNCAVFGCGSSQYRLKKWKKVPCGEHSGILHEECPCPRPYTLHRFPSKLLNAESRKEWIRLMNRTTKKNSAWMPGESDLVCSLHFVDGKPSLENPNPTLNLGYQKAAKNPRRALIRNDPECADCVFDAGEVSSEVTNVCKDCLEKDTLLSSLSEQLQALSLEKNRLKSQVEDLTAVTSQKQTQPFSFSAIKSDNKMKFYTGISTVAMFHVIFTWVKPCLSHIVFWRGSKRVFASRASKTKHRFQKVCWKDQFLLVLMRLRLGLFNEDLADRFCISPSTCSAIFTTWVKLLSRLFGKSSLIWLPRYVIRSNLPSMFLPKYQKVVCIIDCTEIFIEQPKSVDIQAITWSDYKKHNTLKFLIAIAPSGFIMFVSDCYGGRTTDKHICNDSSFYKKLEYGDEVMADRGFQIQEDLLHYYCKLSVPPGARVKSQMTAEECKKTKEIANLRIHVERAINRIKEFKILKNILPINMLPLADDIVRTCASLCNLQPPLIKEKKLPRKQQ